MARGHARIHTAIWSNDDFRTLPAEAQRLYLVLLTQPELTMCGVLDYSAKRVARLAHDTSAAKIDRATKILEQTGYVVIDHDTDELAIRTFMRHDGVTAMPNPLKGAARAWRQIHSPTIRQVVVDALPPSVQGLWPDGVLAMAAKPLAELLAQPLPEGFPQPQAKGSTDGSPNPPGYLTPAAGGPTSTEPFTSPHDPNEPSADSGLPADQETIEARAKRAALIIARRDIDRRIAAGEPIANPVVVARMRASRDVWPDRQGQLVTIAEKLPDATDAQIADHALTLVTPPMHASRAAIDIEATRARLAEEAAIPIDRALNLEAVRAARLTTRTSTPEPEDAA